MTVVGREAAVRLLTLALVDEIDLGVNTELVIETIKIYSASSAFDRVRVVGLA